MTSTDQQSIRILFVLLSKPILHIYIIHYTTVFSAHVSLSCYVLLCVQTTVILFLNEFMLTSHFSALMICDQANSTTLSKLRLALIAVSHKHIQGTNL